MADVEKEPLQDSPIETSQPTAIFQPTSVVHVEEAPRDHLMLSIFMLIFCFFPLGIVAVYMSLRVRNKLSQGEIASARNSSLYAWIISLVGIVIGVLIYIGVTVYIIVLILFAKELVKSLNEGER